jgi:hypothetical protein
MAAVSFILPGFSRRIKKTIDRAIEIFAKAFGIKRYSEQPGRRDTPKITKGIRQTFNF